MCDLGVFGGGCGSFDVVFYFGVVVGLVCVGGVCWASVECVLG